MSDRKSLPGKFVWFELVSKNAKRAQAFYGEVLGWKAQAFPMGDQSYEMIHAGDTMIGGYTTPKSERQPSHWDLLRLGRGRRRRREGGRRERGKAGRTAP